MAKKAKPSRKLEGSNAARFVIPMTPEEIELEQRSNEETIKLLETTIIRSGYFKRERIPELISNLKRGSAPFGRVNTTIAFDGDSYLTVQEKQSLGLNTRMKYSRKFIEYFDPVSFREIEPKAALECMHLDAFHRVSRNKELLRFKKLGFIAQVRIQAGDCAKIKRLKKIHLIEEIPGLPLVGCDAPFCECWYEPIPPKEV